MSLDESLRHYQRQLERDGHDPRAIGAALLGASPDRFLLLVRPEPDAVAPIEPPPGGLSVQASNDQPSAPAAPWRRVTGFHAAPGAERWRALSALPFVTLEELLRATAELGARGNENVAVWDKAESHVVQEFGRNAAVVPWSALVRIEDGWREPRDGSNGDQPSRPERAPSLFVRYVERELRAALERECAAVALTCRGDGRSALTGEPLALVSVAHVEWLEGEARADVVVGARAVARDVARTYAGSSGTLVFVVSSPSPRTVRVRWTVEPAAAPARRPRRTGRRARYRLTGR